MANEQICTYTLAPAQALARIYIYRHKLNAWLTPFTSDGKDKKRAKKKNREKKRKK